MKELNENELKSVNGGWILPLLFAYILLEAALNPKAHIEAFKEGMEMAGK